MRNYSLTRFISFAVVALFLAGCGKPSSEEIASLNYGPYPHNYERIVLAYMNQILKDPVSARYSEFSSPRQFYVGNFGKIRYHGWIVCFTVNAKNSYGAYAGSQPYFLLIRNGQVTDLSDKPWGVKEATANYCGYY